VKKIWISALIYWRKRKKIWPARLEALIRGEANVKQKDEELTRSLAQEKERLHSIANLSAEEAKQILLRRLEEEIT
jgi:hypothetical protein